MTSVAIERQSTAEAQHPVAVGQARASGSEMGPGGERLIRIEGALRHCDSLDQLWCHLANEGQSLLQARQSLVFCLSGRNRWRVKAVGGLARVPHDSAQVLAYQHLVGSDWREHRDETQPRLLDLANVLEDEGIPAMRHGLWIPLSHGDRPIGAGWLLTREHAWETPHLALASRLAQAYGHGASAIRGRRRVPLGRARGARGLALAAMLGLGAALALVQVPLTSRAPAEVVANDPVVVAAPMAGVVARILVAPGARVALGDPLVQQVDVELRNDFEVAKRKVQVAQSKALRLQQAAIASSEAKRELAIARSELRVAEAERDYAHDLLDKAVVRAERSGVALYGDPQDWVGRPVRVGEAVMQVADPADIAFRLEVAAADAVTLERGASVDVFLDAAPLEPVSAVVARAAYKAEKNASGIANFKVMAIPEKPSEDMPRLGLRGTARIHGEPVSLFYYLFRRPIGTFRQLTGV